MIDIEKMTFSLSLFVAALLLVSLSLSISSSITVVSAYNVFLRPGSEQCFGEILKKGDKLLASFAVASGGHLDIDCRVYDPENRIVYLSERRMTDNFQFYAQQDGEYKICFGNSMSTVTGKTVSFHIYAGQKLAAIESAKQQHLSPLENSILQLSENIQAVQDTTEYMKVRERVCHQTNVSTGRRVVGWNIFKTVALICTSLSTIYYLHRFFDRTSK